MEQEFLILCLAIFSAAALQSATGIGFGVIAGPVLLVVLNDNSAIQVSIILNLLIALSLAPSLRQKADRQLLRPLIGGLLIGSPLGLIIYLLLDIGMLKAFAAAVVLFTLVGVIRGRHLGSEPRTAGSGRFQQISIGTIAGIMGGSLAMPGPVPAAWMAARGYRKDTVRATILLMFVFAYTIALLLQFNLAGINANTIWICISYSPATIAGIVFGGFLSKHISERIFRRLLIVVLAATVVVLLATIW
jgi:uncharacterized membrane protein YfcA